MLCYLLDKVIAKVLIKELLKGTTFHVLLFYARWYHLTIYKSEEIIG